MLELISVILTFAPFILILWLANLGQRLRERELPYMPPVVVAYTFLILIYLFRGPGRLRVAHRLGGLHQPTGAYRAGGAGDAPQT